MPSVIQIGPYRFAVELNETADSGQFLHESQKILIGPENGPDARADTLLHEVLHGHFVLLGLREDISKKLEEKIVLALAPLLLDTLRKNPKLVAYLTHAD